MPRYDLTINGGHSAVEAPADMPLLWVLRDMLGLTGAKYGCGRGFCGACTVHVDGSAIQSCLLPVAGAAGRDITTVEGLEATFGREVQQAWREEGVAQCGYCQAGQVMRAAALLATNLSPTDRDVDRAFSNNLCRCGTYLRIRRAVRRAAEMLTEPA